MRDVIPSRRVFLGLSVLAAVAACAEAQRPGRRTGPPTARDYFPLRAGAAWSFDVETGVQSDLGSTVLATLAVASGEGDRYVVRSSGHVEHWELHPDGVVREGDYVLKDPLVVGASWPAHGGGRYEIRSVGGSRTVTAGSFHGVVEVLRTSADGMIGTTTWYAPDVGVVEILATTRSSLGTEVQVRSTLRGYTLGETD